MIALNFTAVVVFLSFWLFVLLLKKLFFDPLQATLRQRETVMTQDKRQADEALAEYFTLAAKVEAERESMRQQALARIQSARQQIRQQAEDQLQQYRHQTLAQLVQQQQQLDTSRQTVQGELQEQTEQMTRLLLEQLLPTAAVSSASGSAGGYPA